MKDLERNRNWCFTLLRNEHDSEEVKYTPEQVLEALQDFNYCIFQLEKAPTTGYLHYQGYISCKYQVARNTITKLLPGIHLEPRHSKTHQEAIAYCEKEDSRIDGPWEQGTKPIDRENQGKRTDLDNYTEDVLNGLSCYELLMKYPGITARYSGFYKQIKDTYYSEIINGFRNINVIYIYGAPGTGKTRYANLMDKNSYSVETKVDGTYIFDGYDYEDTIILDEFRSQMTYSQILSLTGGYKYALPSRYKNINGIFTNVYIISNKPLSAQYSEYQSKFGQDSIFAFYRRISKVMYFDMDNIYTYNHTSDGYTFSDFDHPDKIEENHLSMQYEQKKERERYLANKKD